MTELFEFILSKPLEVLAGISISSATIFTIIKLLAWIISLFTKKKKLKAEKQSQDAIANAVVNKFGGVDNFISQIAQKVASLMIESDIIKNLNNNIEGLKGLTNCPVELKAYIHTILTQDGNYGIYLDYEKYLSALNSQTSNDCLQNFETRDSELSNEQEIVQVIEQKEITHENKVEENDGDIDYA